MVKDINGYFLTRFIERKLIMKIYLVKAMDMQDYIKLPKT